MNKEKSEDDKVPDGWELCRSKSNPSRVYYFNRKTGESSWTKPQDNEKSSNDKKTIKRPIFQEKNSKEDQRKSIKRKSNGNDDTVSSKKQKQSTSDSKPVTDRMAPTNIKSPTKNNVGPKTTKDSPNKLKQIPQKFNSPLKSYPYTKNLANSRLSQLRSRLSEEGAKSDDNQNFANTSIGITSHPTRLSWEPVKPSETKNLANTSISITSHPTRLTWEPAETKNLANSSISIPHPKRLCREPVKPAETKNLATTSINITSHPTRLSWEPAETKNLANTRLSQLRTRLSLEAAKCDEDESPSKLKCSPKKQTDNKNSNSNESKSSTTQSPSNESLQSTPSQSQFFAATKIISAIKVQLSEQLDINMKPKNSFADIEERISKQIPEYPHTKHPTTPPQFSEASKIVSAIHSKISHKVCTKDMPVRKYSSAQERIDSIRRQGNDVKEEIIPLVTDEVENVSDEAMDVDLKEVTLNIPMPPPKNYSRNLDIQGNLVLVVDTNIFIHELDFIKNAVNSHIKGYTEQPTLLIPWRVVSELDRLKDNNNGTAAICKRARAAMHYLYKSLPENQRIRGQSLRDSNSHIYPCESPDDEILNCCLQQAERGKSVILLSNDKILCTKAVTNGVKSISVEDLKILIEHKSQPTANPDVYASFLRYKEALHELLSNILENEMRAKYNKLWQHVVLKPPPWLLSDVLVCVLKHWMAVFSEVFPRIQHLVQDLSNSLANIERKDPSSLSKSEVENFKELSLELAMKCQIIPEYMDLAKVTVERLSRDEDPPSSAVMPKVEEAPKGEIPVIAAFEELWTIFSGYCAKLATALGVPHNIEDKVPTGETLHTLNDKWAMYGRQINALTDAMKGALGLNHNDANRDSEVARLVNVFKQSLSVVHVDSSHINIHNVSLFCTRCRNMLEEACSKFSELSDLLRTCENNVINKVN